MGDNMLTGGPNYIGKKYGEDIWFEDPTLAYRLYNREANRATHEFIDETIDTGIGVAETALDVIALKGAGTAIAGGLKKKAKKEIMSYGDDYIDDAFRVSGGGSKTELARKLGNQGEDVAGIVNSKTRIPSLSGTAKYRIPDELLADQKILREIKNVSKQSYTRQLRDFNQWAKQNGYDFILEVRDGANGDTVTVLLSMHKKVNKTITNK